MVSPIQWENMRQNWPWSSGKRYSGSMSCIFFYIMWMAMYMHVVYLEMALGCTVGRWQASGGSAMLRTMFCWMFIWPSFWHVAPINISADQVYTFIAMKLPDCSGLFQQNIATLQHNTHCSGMVWGTLGRVQGVSVVFKFLRCGMYF